ncbi:SGNH/GDSL hydrolase family protein [Pseudonocardia sp. S2-4]|uniref:SGNH/GDSL hydrolase family protein n=1 Tax=Pseudonocardia humida TaxID=2800819 RepID=A0ABT0ZYL9_9PSEU|nr:SGNH/GDSL hydrolase family protein [Pseudonocardia humida]
MRPAPRSAQPHRSRAARALLAGLLGVAAALVPTTAASAAEPADYVALGDSYAAGPLIPLQYGSPPGCARSDHNYPALTSQALATASFLDVSCSGAKTADLTAPQETEAGTNPPQLDALGAETDLVTISIGGNDIGFSEIVEECATRSPAEPDGAACRDFYDSGGSDELAERIDGTAPEVRAALLGILARSPAAEVLLVGYPTIVPDDGPGCFPAVPFSPGDTQYLRETTKRLNDMLAEQATLAGVDYVDTYTPTIGHDICTPPGVKWVEGLAPTSPAAPVHPNALGMEAMSAAVVGAVG